MLDLMIAMFNRGVAPSIPGRGSIGASDLGLCGHIGAVMIGRGLAWFGGVSMPGAEALAAAGLSPAKLGPKDGLGILELQRGVVRPCRMRAVGAGRPAGVGHRDRGTVDGGLRRQSGIFDARIAAARPPGGQVRASAMFAQILAGSALHRSPPRAIQDALSFRVLAPVYGPALAASQRSMSIALDPSKGWRISPVTAAFLCMKSSRLCFSKQLGALVALKNADPSFVEMSQLAMQFRGLLAGRDKSKLEPWLDRAGSSGLSVMERFVRAIRRDLDAVENAVTEPWSSGRVEDQGNCLKTIKRSMYGRAGHELLRARLRPV